VVPIDSVPSPGLATAALRDQGGRLLAHAFHPTEPTSATGVPAGRREPEHRGLPGGYGLRCDRVRAGRPTSAQPRRGARHRARSRLADPNVETACRRRRAAGSGQAQILAVAAPHDRGASTLAPMLWRAERILGAIERHTGRSSAREASRGLGARLSRGNGSGWYERLAAAGWSGAVGSQLLRRRPTGAAPCGDATFRCCRLAGVGHVRAGQRRGSLAELRAPRRIRDGEASTPIRRPERLSLIAEAAVLPAGSAGMTR